MIQKPRLELPGLLLLHTVPWRVYSVAALLRYGMRPVLEGDSNASALKYLKAINPWRQQCTQIWHTAAEKCLIISECNWFAFIAMCVNIIIRHSVGCWQVEPSFFTFSVPLSLWVPLWSFVTENWLAQSWTTIQLIDTDRSRDLTIW